VPVPVPVPVPVQCEPVGSRNSWIAVQAERSSFAKDGDEGFFDGGFYLVLKEILSLARFEISKESMRILFSIKVVSSGGFQFLSRG
jgi:hypothetical protein